MFLPRTVCMGPGEVLYVHQVCLLFTEAQIKSLVSAGLFVHPACCHAKLLARVNGLIALELLF